MSGTPAFVLCPDEEATRRAGAALAQQVSRGDLVLLEGGLGAGKTVFVRGLAGGMGLDPGEIASPTFALVHEHGPAGEPALVHADLYRLKDGADLTDLGLEDALSHGAVVAIEWPRPPWAALPAWHVRIEEQAGGARRITLERR